MVTKGEGASEKLGVTAKDAKSDVIRKFEKGNIRVKLGQVLHLTTRQTLF